MKHRQRSNFVKDFCLLTYWILWLLYRIARNQNDVSRILNIACRASVLKDFNAIKQLRVYQIRAIQDYVMSSTARNNSVSEELALLHRG